MADQTAVGPRVPPPPPPPSVEGDADHLVIVLDEEVTELGHELILQRQASQLLTELAR